MKLSEKEKKRLSAKEILEIVKKSAGTKFDESVDVSLRINVKQSKGGDFSLRTVVKLPNGSGKKEKVAVLCDPDKIEEAKKSGAEVYGSEDLIEKIASSKFDFTKLIFMGDGDSDAEVLKDALIGIAPKNSRPSALVAADYVTKLSGGNGAVAEACDYLEQKLFNKSI